MLGNMMNFFNQVVGNSVRLNVHLRNSAFYPGNVIEGYVEVVVSSPVPFRAIRVRACGKEMVSIRREYQVKVDTPPGEPQRYEKRVRTEFSKQAVYNQLITLVGTMKTQPIPFETMLPTGTYYYPFAIQLPKNVPPSFSKKITDDYAEIVYYIKAYMDVPMGRDAVTRNFFRVIKPMPVSQHAMAAPFNFQNVYDVTCCCCIDKGKVQTKMFMDRTLIAIDRDNLMVCCDIDNSRGQEPVKSLEISLINNLEYKADWVVEKNRVVAGRHFLEKEIPAGQKSQISGVIPLPRNIVPSLTTYNLKSEYHISIELNIPWASDPMQRFDVIVAQSVDETNFSPPMFFNENKYQRIAKGQFSYPEMYYMPPPQPVYMCVPIPLPPPPNVQMMSYNISIPPLGLPSAMWEQQNAPMVRGQAPAYQPLGIQWQGGYAQAQLPNSVPPPPVMAPPLGYQGSSGGDVNQPLLS